MKSSIVKRSVLISGHKTSVSLEEAFWTGLKDVAHGHRVTLSDLISQIDSAREHGSLSSAIRLFVLHHFHNLFLLHKVHSEEELMHVAKGHPVPR